MNTDLTESFDLIYERFFNSSHFIHGFELKEELHGHNYAVCFYVQTSGCGGNEKFRAKVDLICAEMDNKILIAEDCETVTTRVSESEVVVQLDENCFYRLPRRCCFIINEINSTAECIARYFYNFTQAELDPGWKKVKVVVAEIYQQQEAIYSVVNNSL